MRPGFCSCVTASATVGERYGSFPLVKPLATNASTTRWNDMKTEYDLSKMSARKNPYASKLKRPVTMRLSEDVISYFKDMAEEAGVPYQSLINLYLRDCVAQHRKLSIEWPSQP